ncbi:MAG: hypothetical protein L6Q94_23635, partial [Calditrichia bacterium]|nr:hypothetical protein [Calditrichia bacterium]
MTPVEITAAITGVKTALEIAKTILSLNKDVAVNEKASELLQVTISLQTSIIELQSKYDEIKKSRDDINKKYIESLDWKSTASQYDLEEIHSGVFVYSPNNTHKSPKPNHWLCTN